MILTINKKSSTCLISKSFTHTYSEALNRINSQIETNWINPHLRFPNFHNRKFRLHIRTYRSEDCSKMHTHNCYIIHYQHTSYLPSLIPFTTITYCAPLFQTFRFPTPPVEQRINPSISEMVRSSMLELALFHYYSSKISD